MTGIAVGLADLTQLAAVAKRALDVAGATNHADLMTPSGAFQAIHAAANDLVVATQTAIARARGWITDAGDVADDAPPVARLLWSGDADAIQIDGAVGNQPRARALLGWQIADHMGELIQGDVGDPSGEPSFRILSIEEAAAVIQGNPGHELLLMPIREGDVEDPEMPPSRRRRPLAP